MKRVNILNKCPARAVALRAANDPVPHLRFVTVPAPYGAVGNKRELLYFNIFLY